MIDLTELLRRLTQSSQPVTLQCAECEDMFVSLIVGGDGWGRCVKCNENQEKKTGEKNEIHSNPQR